MRRRYQSRQSARRPRRWTDVESVGSAEGKNRQRRESARALREREQRIMTLLSAAHPSATNFQLREMAKDPTRYVAEQFPGDGDAAVG